MNWEYLAAPVAVLLALATYDYLRPKSTKDEQVDNVTVQIVHPAKDETRTITISHMTIIRTTTSVSFALPDSTMSVFAAWAPSVLGPRLVNRMGFDRVFYQVLIDGCQEFTEGGELSGIEHVNGVTHLTFTGTKGEHSGSA